MTEDALAWTEAVASRGQVLYDVVLRREDNSPLVAYLYAALGALYGFAEGTVYQVVPRLLLKPILAISSASARALGEALSTSVVLGSHYSGCIVGMAEGMLHVLMFRPAHGLLRPPRKIESFRKARIGSTAGNGLNYTAPLGQPQITEGAELHVTSPRGALATVSSFPLEYLTPESSPFPSEEILLSSTQQKSRSPSPDFPATTLRPASPIVGSFPVRHISSESSTPRSGSPWSTGAVQAPRPPVPPPVKAWPPKVLSDTALTVSDVDPAVAAGLVGGWPAAPAHTTAGMPEPAGRVMDSLAEEPERARLDATRDLQLTQPPKPLDLQPTQSPEPLDMGPIQPPKMMDLGPIQPPEPLDLGSALPGDALDLALTPPGVSRTASSSIVSPRSDATSSSGVTDDTAMERIMAATPFRELAPSGTAFAVPVARATKKQGSLRRIFNRMVSRKDQDRDRDQGQGQGQTRGQQADKEQGQPGRALPAKEMVGP